MSAGVVAIIQARMGSTRLPGKVLMDIEGEPMLGRVIARASRASAVQATLVATTQEPSDDAVAEFCRTNRIPCTRGSQFDVLDRYYQAARGAAANTVVRITADCPLLDSALMDEVVAAVLASGPHAGASELADRSSKVDFAANRLPPPWKRTFPIGLDVEACTFEALESAWSRAREPQQREHVMPYLYEGVRLERISPEIRAGTSPAGFRVVVLDSPVDYGAYRWTVDAAPDLEFVRQVYRHFPDTPDFSWKDVLALLEREPELMAINAEVRHKSLGEVDERAGRS